MCDQDDGQILAWVSDGGVGAGVTRFPGTWAVQAGQRAGRGEVLHAIMRQVRDIILRFGAMSALHSAINSGIFRWTITEVG